MSATEKLVKVNTNEIIPIDPMDALVQKAVEAGAVDVLERLLKVRQQVQADRARDAFYSALIGFQNSCPVIEKTTTANIKPGFSYRYTPLEEIAHAIRPLLNTYQLGYRWFALQAGQLLTVTCRISHSLGHIEETSLTVPVGTDAMRPAWPVAQSLTYAKRYTLCNALGIVVGGEDDDAQEPRPDQASQPAERASHEPSSSQSATAPSGQVISEAQAKRMYAIAKTAGQSDDNIKALIKPYGYEHTREVQRRDYEAICRALEQASREEVPF